MAQDDGMEVEDAEHLEGDSEDEKFYSPLEGDTSPEAEALLPLGEPQRKIFLLVGRVEQVVGSLLLVMVLVLVLAQVAQRYIPGAWPWTGELARLSMVWATFLLAGYLIAYPPYHISIRIIDYVVKGRWLHGVKLFVNVVILATSLILLYGAYRLIADDIGQVTAAGEIPLRFVNTIPLIGIALVVIRAVLGIVVRDVPGLLGRDGDAS